MKTISADSEFFDAAATLGCGQIFRYRPHKDGYLVFSRDKACFLRTRGSVTEITVEDGDEEYFRNFFDLGADYSEIFGFAKSFGKYIGEAAESAKGVRILRQDAEETFYSFIISQNNMIPRIKAIIERTCAALGEKRVFDGEEYFTFPTSAKLAEKDEEFYFSLGYGYRSGYIADCAKKIAEGEVDLYGLASLPTPELKRKLLSMKGIGPKVADCVSLFGYHRTDSFPVDTWIEKVYVEDLGGTEKDRKKISESLVKTFGEKSGYVQQYVFYYKRSLS